MLSEDVLKMKRQLNNEHADLINLKFKQEVGLKAMSNDNMLYHVGAVENWVVDCICGTKDDDGERMVECDRCNVWVHTRCYGYPDSGPCPDHFLCVRCAKHHRSA